MTARRLAVGIVAVTGVAVGVAGFIWLASAWNASRLPETYNVMDYGAHDYGGGAAPAAHRAHGAAAHDHARHHGTSVANLRGPRAGEPDARFTLTAQRTTIRLASGRSLDGFTYNGRSPGPELRVRQGDLVEVTLRNRDVERGVTIHWHGVDVPNAEDGVPGVTQNAVLPGGEYTYRFRAIDAGTFWYHTHQASATEVKRGLFGAFVVEKRPSATRSRGLDLAVVAHTFRGTRTLNGHDGVARRPAAPGTRVRLRLINADATPREIAVAGAAFRVAAIDGTDFHAPQPLAQTLLELAAGGRLDVEFTVGRTPVRVGFGDGDAALVLGRRGRVQPAVVAPARPFDPLSYGRPTGTPFSASSDFDRSFRLKIEKKLAFLDGRPGFQWALNGRVFPDVPAFVVREGDLVRMTISNDTKETHPMHLHGHHVLVLSRDGAPTSGSPWWADTLDVKPGETYDVAFRADNPGLWMNHCHNLTHAADGLTMHVAYEGVRTPFTVGGDAHNVTE